MGYIISWVVLTVITAVMIFLWGKSLKEQKNKGLNTKAYATHFIFSIILFLYSALLLVANIYEFI